MLRNDGSASQLDRPGRRPRLASGATPELGTPIEIFTWEGDWGIVTPDAQGRFLHVVEVESEDDEEKPDPTGIVLIENWRTRFVD